LVRARTALCLVGSTAACVALHRSAHNWDYKFSREGADPRSLRGMWECVVCFGWSLFKKNPPHEVSRASPFIVSKGGLGYICGKKMKWRKDEREKQKRWPRVWPSSSLSGGSSFPTA
jgi:hypothetical protein